MTEPTEAVVLADLPPLAVSITNHLTDLAAHAHRHGEEEERTGKRLVQMPECLASHIGALSAVLFGLARPEEADSEIGTTIEIPEGLIEDLQQQITASLEKLGTQP